MLRAAPSKEFARTSSTDCRSFRTHLWQWHVSLYAFPLFIICGTIEVSETQPRILHYLPARTPKHKLYNNMHEQDCCFVKFGWKDDVRSKYRLPFTILPLVCATIISIIPLFGQNYNFNGIFFCDISGSPLGCNYYDQIDSEEEKAAAAAAAAGGGGGGGEGCVRGAGSRQMLLYLGVIPFMVAFVIIIASVSLLIYSVLKQERRMDRFQVVVGEEGRWRSTPPQRKMTNQATKRGIYYVGAFSICWIPWYICECTSFLWLGASIIELHPSRLRLVLLSPTLVMNFYFVQMQSLNTDMDSYLIGWAYCIWSHCHCREQ